MRTKIFHPKHEKFKSIFKRKPNRNQKKNLKIQTKTQPQTETKNKTIEELENNQVENTKTEDENANLVIKTEDNVIIKNGKVKYKTKALDVVIGILGFVYAIGVVATLVVVLLKNIEALKK